MGLAPSPAATVRAEHILLGGRDLAKLDEAGMRRVRGSEISMVFQEPLTALDPVFTIGSQLSGVIRRHRSRDRKMAHASAVEVLERVGIADAARIMGDYPHQLSGGMRQRVMIAMALACRPRVLVADEPTTALDVTTQAQVLGQLAELGRHSGTAILLITHDLGVVAQACDRALVMYCGRIVEEAPVAELFANPAHPYTAGLLAAVPRISIEAVQRVRAIPGIVPHPAMLPVGCHFAERCARADGQCRVQAPALRTMENSPAGPPRRHACHHPLSKSALRTTHDTA
jgi:oligopeptide/dipeptide ABC transporter ATP-binding protein